MADVLVPFINCLLVLDSDGDRIIAKYYTKKNKNDQLKFENLLFKKTKTMTLRSDGTVLSPLLSSTPSLLYLIEFIAEVLLLEQEVVVMKGSSDCRIALSGGIDEVCFIFFFSSSLFFDFLFRMKLFLFIFWMPYTIP